MRIEWLVKNNTDQVVVFFNGWGMDKRTFPRLEGEMDKIVCWDYRTLNTDSTPSFIGYKKINVVAWSMGVWAAANILPQWGIQPRHLVAFNGTERPVDNRWGIPSPVYLLTEKRMNEKGREKFFSRMFTCQKEQEEFFSCRPERELAGQIQELQAIRTQCEKYQHTLEWERAYVSEKDLIFPVENQQNWWEKRGVPTESLPTAHYPFYFFRTWEDIWKSKD